MHSFAVPFVVLSVRTRRAPAAVVRAAADPVDVQSSYYQIDFFTFFFFLIGR